MRSKDIKQKIKGKSIRDENKIVRKIQIGGWIKTIKKNLNINIIIISIILSIGLGTGLGVGLNNNNAIQTIPQATISIYHYLENGGSLETKDINYIKGSSTVNANTLVNFDYEIKGQTYKGQEKLDLRIVEGIEQTYYSGGLWTIQYYNLNPDYGHYFIFLVNGDSVIAVNGVGT